MGNIAAIGRLETVKIINFCGIKDIFAVDNETQAASIIDSLAKRNFAVILVEEYILQKIPNIVLKYKNKKTPSITSLPSSSKYSTDIKKSILYSSIKKIVGADIHI